MDEKTQQEIDSLIQQLAGRNWNVYIATVEQLSKYGESAVPFLIKELYTGNDVQKMMGADNALALIGEPAIPALVEALKSEVSIALHAKVALESMEDKKLVVHYVLKLFETEQQYLTSFSALTVLANTAIKIRNSIGTLKSNVALEALQKLAQYHNNEDVRLIAEKFIEVDTHRYGYLLS